MKAEDSKGLGLLDSLIVIFGSTSLTLVMLWAAGEVSQLGTFVILPDWIESASKHLFALISSGAIGAALVYLIRKQVSAEKKPNYLLWIGGSTIFILLVIVCLVLFMNQHGRPSEKTVSAAVSIRSSEMVENSHKVIFTEYSIEGPFKNERKSSILLAKHRKIDDLGSEGLAVFLDSDEIFSSSGVNYQEFDHLRTIRPMGLCFDKQQNRLALLIKTWTGAATNGSRLFAAWYSPYSNALDYTAVANRETDVLVESDYVSCSNGQAWTFVLGENDNDEVDISMEPCLCNFGGAVFGASVLASEILSLLSANELSELNRAEVLSGKTVPLRDEVSSVDGVALQGLLDRHHRLLDKGVLSVKFYEGRAFFALKIVNEDGPHVGFSALLLRNRDETDWILVDLAIASGKMLHEHLVCDGPAEHIFVEMCLSECDWWGEPGVVEISLPAFEMKLPLNNGQSVVESCHIGGERFLL